MKRFAMVALMSALLFSSGCTEDGPKLVPVDGTVKLDGELKSKLLVTFTPTAKGPIAVGQTNEKGEFKLTTAGRRGAVQGEHKVSITTIFEANDSASKPAATAPSGGDAYMNQGQIRPQDFKLPKETIPARYNKQTELVRVVESRDNKFDFDLSTKPAK